MPIIDSLEPGKALGFGQYFCPWYVRSPFVKGKWAAPEVVPLQSLDISPAAKVLHYGQEIFEGLKVYRRPQASGKNEFAFFRPDANLRRMQRSADIMAMPQIPGEIFMESMKLVAKRCEALIPAEPSSLYLRPAMIGTTAELGVAPATEFLFYMLASPVGSYFASAAAGPASISVWVTRDHVRAVRGGLGAAKTGANYAASLRAVSEAKKLGFGNVLFLDAIERQYLEELSGMNVFIVDEGVLKTPPTGDTILQGITRDSLLKIAAKNGIAAKETPIDIDSLIGGLRRGSITELFACGTGAALTAITELGWNREKIKVGNGEAGRVTKDLYQKISDIYFGRDLSFPDWIVKC